MFRIYSRDDGAGQALEHLPAGAITPKFGMALYQTGGKLAVASAENKATYVCAGEYPAAVADGTPIPVVKIVPDQLWEADCDAPASCKPGTGYDVAAGGLKVNAASSTTGNFVVSYIDTASGKVRGRFA